MAAADIKIAVGLFTFTKERLAEVLSRTLGADDGDIAAIWADLANTPLPPPPDQLPLPFIQSDGG